MVSQKFLFKVLKAFIKPFETPQRRLKIERNFLIFTGQKGLMKIAFPLLAVYLQLISHHKNDWLVLPNGDLEKLTISLIYLKDT